MAGNIRGIVIEIEGNTKGLVKSLDTVNKNLRDTQGQLKLVDKALKIDPTNTEILATKQSLLADAIAQTKEKLDIEKRAAQDAAEALAMGKISKNEYNALQAGIANTAAELNRLENEANESGESVNFLSQMADKAKDALVNGLQNAAIGTAHAIGDAFVNIGKGAFDGLINTIELTGEVYLSVANTIVDASAQIAGAIVDLTAQSIEGYGQLEQFEGGIEKLYGEGAAQVIENANNAFETAGMDASAYLENVTTFSASLISSLGGDTEEAANLADVAMRAMADNASTFGTDMGSLTNVLKNLARGQYNTLDNLNLGFAGTQQGMIDLINTSGILEENIDSLEDVSFDQMILAISTVQEQMGIAGTASAEVYGTLEGSIGAVENAYTNLINGLADPNADLGQLLENMVVAGEAAIRNLVPAITRALGSISEALPQIVDIAMTELPELLDENVPVLLEAIEELILTLAEELPVLAQFLSEQVPDIIDELANTLLDGENVETVMESILDVIDIIINTVDENIDEITDIAIEIILTLAEGIASHTSDMIPKIVEIITTIVEKLTEPDTLAELIEAAFEIIGAIVQGIADALPDIIEAAGSIIGTLIGELTSGDVLSDILEFGASIVNGIVEGIGRAIPALQSAIANIGSVVNGANYSPEQIGVITTGANNIMNSVTGARDRINNTRDLVNGNSTINVMIGADRLGSAMINANSRNAYVSGGR